MILVQRLLASIDLELILSRALIRPRHLRCGAIQSLAARLRNQKVQ